MNNTVEIIEVWSPTDKGDGHALRTPDMKPLKMVARLIGNKVQYLEKDWCIEKKLISKEQYELLFN